MFNGATILFLYKNHYMVYFLLTILMFAQIYKLLRAAVDGWVLESLVVYLYVQNW